MKYLLITLLTFLSLNTITASEEIPEFLSVGLELAIEKGSFAEALPAWYDASPDLTKGEKFKKNVEGISKYERKIGKPVSFEVLGVDSPIPELQVVYIAMKHESGAYFVKLICFRNNNNWELKQYRYATDPTKIIPDSYY